MEYTLYGSEKCPMLPAVMSVASICGQKIKFKAFNGEEYKGLDFHFLRQVPVLETQFGKIFGVSTIMRFFARGSPYTNLYGRSTLDATYVDMIMNYIDSNLFPLISAIHQQKGDDTKSTVSELKKIFEQLDKYFLNRTFAAGERLTISDVLLAITIDSLVLFLKGTLALNNFVNLQRYIDTILGHPTIKKYHGEFTKKSSSGKDSQPKSQSSDSSEKPKKKENPLDSLPPSSMNMDEWKRVYSNTKDLRGVAMPWLIKNFDPSGYCFYYMKYNKLPDELDVAFRASNMVGGFLQRLDNNFRKYSFAVINIVGEGNNFDYQGVFMFRGNDIPEEMRSHPSFEYHSFTMLDFSKEKDRQLITDYFCNDEEVEGLKIQDCKVWK